ncbi:acyl-CoA synthetase (AMP-forming)/AMP-acid ligase II [Rhodobacter aestuarii]|uniref:Acyl-CoA synthetase (AMP-forming)/AMP-acid ligase II n=1 Tax=Rhodobacter aestuarii TaxID=453582 RepID=A0A1N7JBH6_9RHOB|nr:class I adenylate-forming enzyme family protein [Rhodobacter aestuarii]PTV96963.1 acyl-CoA synthetase (AMP-forming)/AMP-acid ligase II [Rhodobacter aestuarii]SIS46742.1 Acyl-CoA synthetase (AMP-forming)/AMP-acid ligase II [Rhodobacter aestuarii]
MLSVHVSSFPAPPAAFNMAAHVLAHADRLAEKSALQILRPTGAERWSYGRLAAAVRGAGTGLLQAGLQPGNRVLLRLGNTPEFPVAFLGAITAGLVPVPTSAQLTEEEITKMAAQITPAAVIAGERIALPTRATKIIPEAELRGYEALPPCDYRMGAPDELAYIVFTSGTSGTARAVAHAHRAIWARQMMHAGWYGLDETDRLLHAGAFNWTYTLGTGLMDPWSVGATALIPADGVAPATLPLLLKRFDATIFAGVPGVYRQMLKQHPKLDLPKLRHGLSAGEALPALTRAHWAEATGTAIYEALGMSECSTFISSCPDHPAPEGAMGWPQPGRHIAVLGEDGAPVPRGAPGELAVHRSDPGLFLTYVSAETEARAKFTEDGQWFRTGDMVRMTPEGAIAYQGRDDDMMNAGGFRVSPLEVEATMTTCADAGEVAAVELRISEETSLIALAYTGTACAEDLAAHASTHLARYKQPRIFQHFDQLPHNRNGKIDRKSLRNSWPELEPRGTTK